MFSSSGDMSSYETKLTVNWNTKSVINVLVWQVLVCRHFFVQERVSLRIRIALAPCNEL